ncbi:class I SAM-dependent methyltransferase [Cytobacillus purgationiresistens]|uniref:Ubiquinone/menaquinone biosynthesis C-methylase UbiE n=1 Tax=Cytobacillus purgationiresistens TaxID=863449 RepID=A0ABU0AL88_9BACI|nr:class I SAM-dependent methyltransferase [Cytobacillus purgationiresistens]MDQ0272034.1 ubiquinone/menaquinone biosynthesis C-methylase UbiE [Cytobacillus purgationiresistens]
MGQFEWAKESEKQWGERADGWNSRSEEMWESGSRKDIAPFFIKHLNDGSKVCDLGCGDGYGSLKLASSGFEVTGIDVAEVMVQKARTVNKGQSATFIKGDIASLPFQDEDFDGILAINSLEWTEKPLLVLEEIKRVLKPGGLACVGILGPTSGPRQNSFPRLYGEEVICNTIMPWEFEALALQMDFNKVDELGVYKKAAEQLSKGALPIELKQALSFMWVFLLRK